MRALALLLAPLFVLQASPCDSYWWEDDNDTPYAPPTSTLVLHDPAVRNCLEDAQDWDFYWTQIDVDGQLTVEVRPEDEESGTLFTPIVGIVYGTGVGDDVVLGVGWGAFPGDRAIASTPPLPPGLQPYVAIGSLDQGFPPGDILPKAFDIGAY